MSTLDQAMNYLADKFVDNGWHNLINGVEYRKLVGIVYVRAYITGNAFNTSYKVIGTLPSGYRPKATIYAVCGFSSAVEGIVYVSDVGNIGVKTDSGSAPNVWFCISYPADN